MSGASKAVLREGVRERAYGQDYEPTLVDRFGVWLSARQLRRYAGPFSGTCIGDFGCGYHAAFVRTILPEVDHAVLVDSALALDLKNSQKITAIEGTLPDVLVEVQSCSLDVVMCVSVLEHLWDPLTTLQHCS